MSNLLAFAVSLLHRSVVAADLSWYLAPAATAFHVGTHSMRMVDYVHSFISRAYLLAGFCCARIDLLALFADLVEEIPRIRENF